MTTLAPFAYQNEHRRTTTAERLSQLDPAQRDAVAAVLRHLADRWNMDDAREALRGW